MMNEQLEKKVIELSNTIDFIMLELQEVKNSVDDIEYKQMSIESDIADYDT